MSAHTPGPWIWGDDYKGLYGAGPENEVLNHEPYEGMWLGYGPSREANARLIAAAPDMMTALRALLDEARSLNDADLNCDPQQSDEYRALVAACDAALEKAGAV